MIIGLDSETHLIKPGMMAPRIVCLSLAWRDSQNEIDSSLLDRPQGLTALGSCLEGPDVIAIHNAPFDLGCACADDPSLLPLVFRAYAEHRIRCTITRQKLIDVALGMRKFRRVKGVVAPARYALADLVQLYYGEHLEKLDTWRLRYAFLDGVPIEQWPQDACDYAISDARWHLRVYEAQEREIAELWGELPNQVEQQRAAWVLHLMSMWGVRADKRAVDRFIANCEEHIAKMHEDLVNTKIFKDKRGGGKSRDMTEIKRRVVAAFESRSEQVPRTDPSPKFPEGQVCTDKETLQLTEDPELILLAEQMVFAKHLSQWGPACRAAVLRPVCASYNVLVDSGRTSCSSGQGQEASNFQNPPRDGDVRPCFRPREGYLFCSTDADTIEMRAHAQNCLEMVGFSKMAEFLWAQAQSGGPDLHEVLAATMMDISPEEMQRRVRADDKQAGDGRQFAKIPGYGFMGGLGSNTFVSYAASQLKREDFLRWFSEDRKEQVKRAKKWRDQWFDTFPENRPYQKKCGELVDEESGTGTIRQRMSGRIRGGARFTAIANGFFQGRVADAMKEVLWHLAHESYTGRTVNNKRSVLYGSRPAYFLHDEPILEHPEDGSESERAERQRQIMVECLSRWMPDVPCTSSAVLTRRWFKGAKPIKINGKLVPVKPEKYVGADGKARVKWIHDTGEPNALTRDAA